tara:strand:- start:222 stop:602 length:381 start_codon:yes stop_codon:yes gene_type:complete
MAKEIIVMDVMLYDVEINNTYYGRKNTINNTSLSDASKSLQVFEKSIKINNKGIGGALFFDVQLLNKTNGIETNFTKAKVSFLVASLRKLDGKINTNEKTGTAVSGKSTNSRNTKPNKTQYNNLKT